MAVIICGLFLIGFGYRPLARFVTGLIPRPVQIGTAVGIGLITALAGCTEIDLVRSGEYTILEMGPITDEVVLTLSGVAIVAILVSHHIQGAFSIVLVANTFLWWCSQADWPTAVVENPTTDSDVDGTALNIDTLVLIFDMAFLGILLLNGLVESFTEMAGLYKRNEDGNTSTPRGRWIFVVCGIASVISGFLSGPPILISPESAAGIKAGARTGLSTFICGLLFCISTFFSPFFASIPNCATAPLLIMVGVLLFQNAKKVDWGMMEDAVPAFCVLFFVPFTYSILQGVIIGYIIYLIVNIFSRNSLRRIYGICFGEEERSMICRMSSIISVVFLNDGNFDINNHANMGHDLRNDNETSDEISLSSSKPSLSS
jgi:AGZA family xanthine/uracil permease-like MFS transporter